MLIYGDLDHNGELTKEELDKYLDAHSLDNPANANKQGGLYFTEEQKAKQRAIFEEADVNNDGKVTTTEAINYNFQHGKNSISQDELTQLYGEEKTKELMKFDANGDGKLNADEFKEATTTKEKKGFLESIKSINFKDPKVILAIVGIAVTVIGVIVGLCVWLSRKSKKEKEKREQAKMDQQLQNISQSTQSTSASSGNLAEKVHTPMSSQIQEQSNDTFSQYSQSSINNTQQPLSLNDSRRSTEISM